MTEEEMTEEEFRKEYMGQQVSDTEIIDFLQREKQILKEEIAELKAQNSILKNDVRVAREDREQLQIKVGKGLKEFIHDCPYTALKHYASARLVEENAELKAQNKGLIHLLESIQSAVSGIKKNKDKEIVLYWIKENAIRVFKEEKQKGFSFDWLK